MSEFFQRLFSSDFMPQGHSFFWEPSLVWLHVISDVLIAVASYSISIALYYMARKRGDFRMLGLGYMFAGFIFACGTGHLLLIWNIWHSTYRLQGMVKAITAVLSIATAIVAIHLASTVLKTEPPEQLDESKVQVREEVCAREHAEELRRHIETELKATDELRRVNEELRRSNVEIEQFAHVASHDLQEPLRMITNYLQLVERRYGSILDEDGREFIHYAVDGAKRMKALIAGLLDFSRVGTTLSNHRLTLGSSILQDALVNLKAAIDESGAQISADPLPSIVVDPISLTQVFQNLIANAIKFHKGTKPHVHISAKREADEWIFSVRDNGIGIELRHIDRIFRIFERLHGAEEYPGSGIGLAITKKIVERHGGRIWAESTPGVGSTFYFSVAVEKMFAAHAGNGTAS